MGCRLHPRSGRWTLELCTRKYWSSRYDGGDEPGHDAIGYGHDAHWDGHDSTGDGHDSTGDGYDSTRSGYGSWRDASKHGARDEHGHGARNGFWHEHDARDEHRHDSGHGHDASGLCWYGDGRLGRHGDAWPNELLWWWRR